MAGRHATPLLIAIAVVACDQWTKRLIVGHLGPESGSHRLEIGVPWFSLEYAENRGVAFGLLTGHSVWLPLVAGLVLAIILTVYLRQPQPPLLLSAGVGLALGGAIGNLIDRLRLGFVVDFISVGRWPNFNLADSAISLGVLMIGIWALWDGPHDNGERTVPVATAARRNGEGTQSG